MAAGQEWSGQLESTEVEIAKEVLLLLAGLIILIIAVLFGLGHIFGVPRLRRLCLLHSLIAHRPQQRGVTALAIISLARPIWLRPSTR